jgi:hypothetical protein
VILPLVLWQAHDPSWRQTAFVLTSPPSPPQ